jgi:hypothetical protein
VSVYRLFALSNAGSLLALLAYPVLIEPAISTRLQAWIWSGAYAGFALLAAGVGWRYRNKVRDPSPFTGEVPRALAPRAASPRRLSNGARSAPGEASGRAQRLAASGHAAREPHADRILWLLLAALPSALLIAVTNHMLRTVAAIPLLWIVPLALYLLSFIICFDHARWYVRPLWHGLFPLAVGTMILSSVAPFLFASYAAQLAAYAGAFFISCMVCHGELASLKPPPAQLTSYYLTISSGGALGGFAAAVVMPLASNYDNDLAIALAVMTALIAVVAWRLPKSVPRWVRLNGLLLPLFAWPMLYLVVTLPLRTGGEILFAGRNFYGPLQVRRIAASPARAEVLELRHGTTVHGREFTAADGRCRPLTYYAPVTGVGAAIAARRGGAPLNVGIIGLGAGSIAGYGTPGDSFRFYEIDPLVRSVAMERFAYLDCGESTIVMGDARLSLAREAPRNFDLLAVDAFTGDAIPVHLLTREAFAVYERHLAPDGILAVHVSNTFVDLVPVVARLAAAENKAARVIANDADFANGVSQSVWVLVARSRAAFDNPALKDAVPLPRDTASRPWTDDYSNLWTALKW